MPDKVVSPDGAIGALRLNAKTLGAQKSDAETG